jgi:hypothetical protein
MKATDYPMDPYYLEYCDYHGYAPNRNDERMFVAGFLYANRRTDYYLRSNSEPILNPKEIVYMAGKTWNDIKELL